MALRQRQENHLEEFTSLSPPQQVRELTSESCPLSCTHVMCVTCVADSCSLCLFLSTSTHFYYFWNWEICLVNVIKWRQGVQLLRKWNTHKLQGGLGFSLISTTVAISISLILKSKESSPCTMTNWKVRVELHWQWNNSIHLRKKRRPSLVGVGAYILLPCSALLCTSRGSGTSKKDHIFLKSPFHFEFSLLKVGALDKNMCRG